MKDRQPSKLKTLGIMASAGVLAATAVAPVHSQDSSPSPDPIPDAYRTGVIVENGIIVCYSETYPETIYEEGVDPSTSEPLLIVVDDAYLCVQSDGLSMEPFENVDAELFNWGGYEIIDLFDGVNEPPMFEHMSLGDKGSVIYANE